MYNHLQEALMITKVQMHRALSVVAQNQVHLELAHACKEKNLKRRRKALRQESTKSLRTPSQDRSNQINIGMIRCQIRTLCLSQIKIPIDRDYYHRKVIGLLKEIVDLPCIVGVALAAIALKTMKDRL